MENPETQISSPEAAVASAGLVAIEENWRQRFNKKTLLRYAAIGSAALSVAAAYGGWNHIETSGKVLHIRPTVNKPIKIDNVESIISWNMHGEAANHAGEIQALADENNTDAIELQEVSADDATRLGYDFPAWNISYVLADKGQNILQNGYGNAIMTRQDPRDITSRSFGGTSFLNSLVRTGLGLGEGVANLALSTAGAAEQAIINNGQNYAGVDASFQDAKDGRQERRAAIAITNQVRYEGKLTDIRIINGHISGNSSVHKRQLRGFMKFVTDNTKPGRATIVCADFNGPAKEIATAASTAGFAMVDESGPYADVLDDFCLYPKRSIFKSAEAVVLGQPMTDHFPMIITLQLPGPTKQTEQHPKNFR